MTQMCNETCCPGNMAINKINFFLTDFTFPSIKNSNQFFINHLEMTTIVKLTVIILAIHS